MNKNIPTTKIVDYYKHNPLTGMFENECELEAIIKDMEPVKLPARSSVDIVQEAVQRCYDEMDAVVACALLAGVSPNRIIVKRPQLEMEYDINRIPTHGKVEGFLGFIPEL